jgi:O-acetyl-ADP-ribose deacetylase (regulator of RNase III)
MAETFFDGRLIVKHGDITEEAVDAIINAANSTLLGGGGVDGAIHRAAGPTLLEECQELRDTQFPIGLPTGEAAMTTGGDLAAKYVIHTVGPIYGRHDGKEADLLASCYRNSVTLGVNSGLQTFAFPSISTGAYGYPKHEAARVVGSVMNAIISTNRNIEIHLVFFSSADSEKFIKHSGLKH